MTVMLTQAELQLEAHEFERALATLKRLEELHPGHSMGLALLARPRIVRSVTTPRSSPCCRGWARAPLEARELEGICARCIVRAHVQGRLHACGSRGTLGLAAGRIAPSAGADRGARPDTRAARAWRRGRTRAACGHSQRLVEPAHRCLWPGDGRRCGPTAQARRRLASSGIPKTGPCCSLPRGYASRTSSGARHAATSNPRWRSTLGVETYALYGRLLTQLGEGERAAAAYRSGLGLVTASAGAPALAAPPQRAKG